MLKGVFYKEYIKTRRTLLWMLLVLIGATFALFLFVNHEIEVKQVSFFWFQQMVSNNLFFVWMLPVFPLMAAIFGVVQFLPETIGRRFRLSLFMPENELVISFSMLGFGLLALTLLFTLQFVVFAVLFSGIITLIWLLAAAKVFVCFWLFSFATYLLIVLIFIAQKTTYRMVLAVTALVQSSILFIKPQLNIFDCLIPYAAILVMLLFFSTSFFIHHYKTGSYEL